MTICEDKQECRRQRRNDTPMYRNRTKFRLSCDPRRGWCGPRSRIPRRARLARRLFAAVVLCVPLAFAAQSMGQTTATRETIIKAAYVLKFPRYVTWPEGAFKTATSPVVVGVLEGGSIGPILQRRAPTATAKGRKIVVLRFKSLDDYRPCHVLFVPRSVDGATQIDAIARTRKLPVLVVGERGGFASAGGTVNFYIDADATVGFEINPDAATEHRLQVDAQLLRLARMVKARPPSQRN